MKTGGYLLIDIAPIILRFFVLYQIRKIIITVIPLSVYCITAQKIRLSAVALNVKDCLSQHGEMVLMEGFNSSS